MTTISISEAKEKLGALSEKVLHQGESFGLTQDDQVVALIVPPQALSAASPQRFPTGAELAEYYARLPRLPPDEAEAFARDVEVAIAEGNRAPQFDPWAP